MDTITEIIEYLDNKAYALECCDTRNDWSEAQKYKRWSKALASLPIEAPREGWALVPMEPTVEMLHAAEPAFKTINAWCAEMQLARGRVPDWTADNPPLVQAWRAMLAAVQSRSDQRSTGDHSDG